MRSSISPTTSSLSTPTSTFSDEETLPSIDGTALDDITGGCAACGTPGQQCQQPTGAPPTSTNPVDRLMPLLQSFAGGRR